MKGYEFSESRPVALSPRERALLVALQFHPDLTAVEAQRLLGGKVHTIHYTQRKLHDLDLLRRSALVNLFRLGAREYNLYFSSEGSSGAQRRTLKAFLTEHPEVIWAAQLSGPYHFLVTFIVWEERGALSFMDALCRHFQGELRRKELVEHYALQFFAKTHLLQRSRATQRLSVTITGGGPRLAADETDLRILEALAQGFGGSQQALAKKLGIARTTLQFRIERLRNSGLLSREVHYIQSSRLGYQTYKVAVSLAQPSQANQAQVTTALAALPSVTLITHTLGPWDIEATIEVRSAGELGSLVDTLLDSCSTLVANIETFQVLAPYRSSRILADLGARGSAVAPVRRAKGDVVR